MTAVGTARRGRPRDEAIDAAILDATMAEMIEVGFFAMSMESVAARAGVAKTTVYRRWSDVTELGLDALRRLKGPVEEPPAGTAREQIMWLAERTRRMWADPTYAAAMRRLIAEGTAHPQLYRQSRQQLLGPHLKQMNAAITRAQDDGSIRADLDVNLLRRMLVGPVLSAPLTLQKIPSAEELRFIVTTVLRGLAP